MMIRKWKTIGSEPVQKTPIFSLSRVRREHPDPEDGRAGDFFVIDSPDWVNVIALTGDDQLVMVRQYRHGSDEVEVEIPAGLAEPGEDPLVSAQRELREETGYTSEDWIHLGTIQPNPAFMNNRCRTYLARDARCTDPIDPDEHEELSVELWPVDDLFAAIDAGEVDHAIVICAAYHFLRWLGRQG